jgi:hypothetical protein
MIRQAAQGQVLHNDDTTMKLLELAAPLSGCWINILEKFIRFFRLTEKTLVILNFLICTPGLRAKTQ